MRPSTVVVGALLWVLSLAAGPAAAAGERFARVAVFPAENLSGSSVPAEDIRHTLIERLTSEGTEVLADEALEAFMTRRRVRYAAGVDAATADALRQDTGVDGVVVVSVELFSDVVPPKIALMARLVSVQGAPRVVWADDVGLAGDEKPGLLATGVVNDPLELLARAVDGLASSLVRYLKTGEVPAGRRDERFRPRVTYQGLRPERGAMHTVAVLPFFNRSARRNAGDLLALLFVRHLSAVAGFRVVDPGDVRQQLLQARVIMDGGISLDDAGRVAEVLDADFVLGGRVLYYEDFEGPDATPRVDFSVVLIERRSGRVAWSSHSYNSGSDGVRFFGRGRVATAHAMATRMVQLTTEMITGGSN